MSASFVAGNPGKQAPGALQWARANLFSSWFNTLLTLLCIGFLWPIWDSKRQTFADKIMNTVVVMKRSGVIGGRGLQRWSPGFPGWFPAGPDRQVPGRGADGQPTDPPGGRAARRR